ncbi:hypothetical protein EDC04DRAFT_98915 [Pisolithus marmoratus]|nr:hypothetical protein EDC04DRAFT_98915 [Pisolithus marmoratus]
MANNWSFRGTSPSHGSTRYPVYPGPVREALNSSCGSLPPYTSPTHLVSTGHTLPSATTVQSSFPPTITGSSLPGAARGFPPSGVRSTLFAGSTGLPGSSGDARFHGPWPSNAHLFPAMFPHLHGSRSATPESVIYFTTSASNVQQSVCVHMSHTPAHISASFIAGLSPVSHTVPTLPCPHQAMHQTQHLLSRQSADPAQTTVPSSFVNLNSIGKHVDQSSLPATGAPKCNMSTTTESKPSRSKRPRTSKLSNGKSASGKNKCKGKAVGSACSICDKIFTRAENLRRHVKRIHGEEQTGKYRVSVRTIASSSPWICSVHAVVPESSEPSAI